MSIIAEKKRNSRQETGYWVLIINLCVVSQKVIFSFLEHKKPRTIKIKCKTTRTRVTARVTG